MSAPVLVVGHSHLRALQDALRAAPQLARRIGFDPEFVSLRRPGLRPEASRKDGAIVVNPALLAVVREALPPRARIVSCLHGNAHIWLSFIEHQRRFDFALDEAPELPIDPSAERLPQRLVVDAMRGHLERPIAILRAVAALSSERAVHLEPPPPIGDAEYLERFAGKFAAQLQDARIAPAALRRKMWLVQRRVMREACAQLDVDYVPVPDVALDAEGCLARAAWGEDPSHGNRTFGRWMLIGLGQRLGTAIADADAESDGDDA